jgi:putative PIG3 family NAD(P)H quinone oxidoreductase
MIGGWGAPRWPACLKVRTEPYPAQMYAMTLPTFGGPQALVWAEVPDPEPAPGEVLLDVAATAVNRADTLQRQGFYPPPPGSPLYPGMECSGTVAALTDGVTGWSVGDQVCALLAAGGYAERVAVPAGQLLPVPSGVDLRTAGGLPEAACTVWSNVVDVARLQAGELFCVHGGGSGIGTFAIQFAAALGARVACTVGSAAKADRCRELGADVIVNYRQEDFVERLRAATDGRGADVVLDIMGGSYLGRNVAVLAPDGRLVVIGLQGGRKAELDIAGLLGKRGAVHATSLRYRPPEQKAAIVSGVRRDVWPLIAAGRVRPIVDRVLPLREAAEGHRTMEAGEHFGKVLLTV